MLICSVQDVSMYRNTIVGKCLTIHNNQEVWGAEGKTSC